MTTTLKAESDYVEVARQACKFEKEGDWSQAFEYWMKANDCAARPDHQTWSRLRAEFCAARSGNPIKLKRLYGLAVMK